MTASHPRRRTIQPLSLKIKQENEAPCISCGRTGADDGSECCFFVIYWFEGAADYFVKLVLAVTSNPRRPVQSSPMVIGLVGHCRCVIIIIILSPTVPGGGRIQQYGTVPYPGLGG